MSNLLRSGYTAEEFSRMKINGQPTLELAEALAVFYYKSKVDGVSPLVYYFCQPAEVCS